MEQLSRVGVDFSVIEQGVFCFCFSPAPVLLPCLKKNRSEDGERGGKGEEKEGEEKGERRQEKSGRMETVEKRTGQGREKSRREGGRKEGEEGRAERRKGDCRAFKRT